jgi:hypothetical protein
MSTHRHRAWPASSLRTTSRKDARPTSLECSSKQTLIPPSPLAVAVGAYAGMPDDDQSSRRDAEAMEAKAAESCEAEFRRELERAGVKGECHVLDATSLHAIIRQAGYADLIIIGQVKPGADKETTDLPAEIALACGRPVLVVPEAGIFEAVGGRIMIVWKAGRESIRAVALAAGADRQVW